MYITCHIISQDNFTGSSIIVRYSEESFQGSQSPAPARRLTASEFSDSEEEGDSGNLPGLLSHPVSPYVQCLICIWSIEVI